MFDYGTLREIWWLLLGVLLIGFALTDGYDLGVGAILRLLGKDDVERRMVIEAIEPNWEGNQVRSEEHTSELQSLMRISYAVFCLKKKKRIQHKYTIQTIT